MEELVRINTIYLDNLLRQYISFRMYKGSQHRDDVRAIKENLQEHVEMVYNQIADQVTISSTHSIGDKYFNGRAIKLEYKGDWKLLRQLRNFESVRTNILNELTPQPSDNIFRRPHSKYSSSIVRKYERRMNEHEEESKKNIGEIEVEMPLGTTNRIYEQDEEYFEDDKWNLVQSQLIISDLSDLKKDDSISNSFFRSR